MKNQWKVYAAVALLVMVGCKGIEHNKILPKTVVPLTAKLGGSQVTRQLENYEAKYEVAKARYDKAIVDYRANIERTKKATDAHLSAGEFGPALDNLAALYRYTHPCGEESCNTYPCGDQCSEVNRYEAYMEREEIDSEREFILKAVDRAYALTDQLQKERRFDELDVALAKHAASIPGPPANAEKFTARHAELKQAWIDTLVADAGALEADKPGAAALLYGKSARLALQKGDEALTDELSKKSRAMTTAAISKYRYGIAFGSSSGPYASDFVSFLKGKSFDGEVVVRSGDNASISISTAEPSYRRSKGSTTDSFQYKSGTKEVPNKAYANKEDSCRSDENFYNQSIDSCERGGPNNVQCGEIESEKEDWDKCLEELSQIPTTVTVDVFDDYSYDVELFHLDASMNITAKIDHADGRRAVSFSGAKVRVTDRAHDAHERNGSGVSRDAANPPSESSGFSSLKADIEGQLAALVMKSFEQYRSALADRHSDGGDAEMDMLAVYVLLRPSNVPEERRERLKELSQMTDAVESLTEVP
jgi:hypothetical protein